METTPIMETIAEVAEATTPVVNEVIEVIETNDYITLLTDICTSSQNNERLLGLLVSFGLFAVVVCLCYFCYKFFRIFF